MPPETISCENCKYADLTLGRYQGRASLSIISRHKDGTIAVPLKERKKVWVDNVNQKQLNSVLNDISLDLEAFAISGSPSINDFTFLERFKKLKYVDIWWNNKAVSLWNIAKTPEIEFLELSDANHLTDISQLQNAKKLRYLSVSHSTGCLSSIKTLEYHPSLEFITLYNVVADSDIRPLITMPKLKYLDCRFNIFYIEAYAMFETRRTDVETTFYEGLSGYTYDNAPQSTFVGLVGKRQGLAEYKDKTKQNKHRKKYLSLKEKYSTVDFVPVLKSLKVSSPVKGWRDSRDGTEIHTKEQLDEIEKIIMDYANLMTSGIPKARAKILLKETIKKIKIFNERTDFVETEERQEIYDYLSSFINPKWYDEFEEMLSEVDW